MTIDQAMNGTYRIIFLQNILTQCQNTVMVYLHGVRISLRKESSHAKRLAGTYGEEKERDPGCLREDLQNSGLLRCQCEGDQYGDQPHTACDLQLF